MPEEQKNKDGKKKRKEVSISAKPPIVFASNPDVAALAGIWKNKEISLRDLREKAWGKPM
jgi:hypothetical protein